jgi:biopolymer transport protein ExbD
MIKLKGAKVEATTDKKKENCFVIEVDGETHLFSAENDASVNEWVAAIKENLKKEPGEAGKGSKMVSRSCARMKHKILG